MSHPTEVPSAPESTSKQTKYYGPASTYWQKPRAEKLWHEKLCTLGDSIPSAYAVHEKRGSKPPYHPALPELVWILAYAVSPMAIQLAATKLLGWRWPIFVAWPFYWGWFVFYIIRCVDRFNHYTGVYGSFDENRRPRDRVPDKRTHHLAWSVLAYLTVRTALPFLAYYKRDALPAFRASSLPRMGLWLIVLDLAFYCYHRSCHEVPWLWSIHRQHHSTKHPTALLALTADNTQEVLELLLCPLFATQVVKMNFWELYCTICITVYVEIAGHTGIRADWPHPLLGPLLRLFDCELAIEDHDLHHRYGKGGKNFGKQSRVWDKIFGTVAPREETAEPVES